MVRKHWGVTRGATREEKLAEIRRLNNDLRAGIGDSESGRKLFVDRCASCHRFFGQGESLGPDLSYANRHDRDFLLKSLVDPAGVVRKEYQAYQLAARDGRVLSGLIVEQSPEAITLRDAKGVRTQIARADVEELKESDVSLMPESLYKELSPQQLRDLFSFLQGDPPALVRGAEGQAGAGSGRVGDRRGADLILAWGGDGMVRRCINALGDTQIPLGILPAGTANLFASYLGIEADLTAALRSRPARRAPPARRRALRRRALRGDGGSRAGRGDDQGLRRAEGPPRPRRLHLRRRRQHQDRDASRPRSRSTAPSGTRAPPAASWSATSASSSAGSRSSPTPSPTTASSTSGSSPRRARCRSPAPPPARSPVTPTSRRSSASPRRRS